MSDRRLPDDLPTQRRPNVTSRLPPAERIPHGRISSSLPSERQADKTQYHQPPSSGRRGRPAPRTASLSVPWWGFAIVILVVAALTCGMWGLVLMNRGSTTPGFGPTPTPIFVVITATPTLGPSPTPTLSGEVASAPSATPSPEVQPSPTVTVMPVIPIQIGSTVMITGTEGDGLAVRQGPGLDFPYFFVGNDGDQFVVEDGPREADGYVWWYISDPNDSDRTGWAVENYLQAIQP
jgi:hypothetical protein